MTNSVVKLQQAKDIIEVLQNNIKDDPISKAILKSHLVSLRNLIEEVIFED